MTYAGIAAALAVLALAVPARGQNASNGKGWNGNFQKPSDEELRKKLTPIQYDVTQHAGTERAFSNEYHDNHRAGDDRYKALDPLEIIGGQRRARGVEGR